MAVYTAIDEASLSAFLAAYDIGAPLQLQGIAEGVENSNYLLVTARGRFILTLYEKRVDPADLPFERLRAGVALRPYAPAEGTTA